MTKVDRITPAQHHTSPSIPANAGIQYLSHMPIQPAIYILASQRNGTLYIGATSDLVQRVWQHKTHEVEGFSNRYGVDKLVHFELFEDMLSAIAREKQLKKWNRAWKVELIESQNPTWRDLWDEII